MKNLRVVDQHIDLLELRGKLLYERANFIRIGDAQLNRQHPHTIAGFLINFRSNLLEGVDTVWCQDELEIARRCAGKFECGGLANSRRGAGYEYRLTLEALGHRGYHGAWLGSGSGWERGRIDVLVEYEEIASLGEVSILSAL